ncbi:hypothetical protein B0H13DRAFT_2229654 [Mycena leptocephala]|nr:hypothetical protein B0H13DRAFT_2229654 [Mycena leptocephala]
MNAPAKYSTLPDIDTAQDVYETEDPVPSKADAASDDEAAPSRSAIRGGRTADTGASKEELDSTNLMQLDEASKKFRKAEKRRDRPRTHYAYPPSPTDPTSPIEPSTSRPVPLSQRLRALQAEVMSLETELADPANPALFKEREEDSVDPGELIRGLVDVRGRLDKIRKGKEGRGRLVGVILGQDDEKEPDTKPKSGAASPNVRSIVEMDRRVGELEKLVGSSSPLPQPVLPLVTRLNAQLTLLTQPRHIDSISRRLNYCYLIWTAQRLPNTRIAGILRTQFESTLEGLEEDHRKCGRRWANLKARLEENRGVVKGNVNGLEGRVDTLLKRVDELGRGLAIKKLECVMFLQVFGCVLLGLVGNTGIYWT